MARHEIILTAEELQSEEWRDVPGYEGIYSISSLGRVRRDAPASGTRPGAMLSIRLTHDGYPCVGLYKNRHLKGFRIHQLVALAFIGPRAPRMTVNHKDGVKTNNQPSNLEYMTARENLRHAFVNGLVLKGNHVPYESRCRGERVNTAKLTADQVAEIFILHRAGWGQVELAQRFGCTRTNIRFLLAGKTWRHLTQIR